MKRRIGVDFDNTLISYDSVFLAYAAAEGVRIQGSAHTKQSVRDLIRSLPDGETRWQALQGRVYGRGIFEASPLRGARDFLARCSDVGWEVCVISHKTEFGHFDPDQIRLRDVAVAWLEDRGFFDEGAGLTRDGVYWEPTREAKLDRIAASSCDLFIDDLEELLLDPRFPTGVERILLSVRATDIADRDRPYVTCGSWGDVEKHVFG